MLCFQKSQCLAVPVAVVAGWLLAVGLVVFSCGVVILLTGACHIVSPLILSAYLSLGQSEVYRKLGAFWQPEVLGPLKSSLELLDL